MYGEMEAEHTLHNLNLPDTQPGGTEGSWLN